MKNSKMFINKKKGQTLAEYVKQEQVRLNVKKMLSSN
jgi:hypothetical protein